MKIQGVNKVVVFSCDETGRELEYHFPIEVEEGDKVFAEMFIEILAGRNINLGEITVTEMDRVHAVKLEILLEARNTARRKTPVMYHFVHEGGG